MFLVEEGSFFTEDFRYILLVSISILLPFGVCLSKSLIINAGLSSRAPKITKNKFAWVSYLTYVRRDRFDS